MEEITILDSEQKIIDAITDFNNDLIVQQLESFYYNQSVPEIFGVSRQETSHSSFLAWLFTPTANHGLGSKPLIQLLELYLRNYRKQQRDVSVNSTMPTELKNAILVRSISIVSVNVKLEDFTETSTSKGRADIVIYCDVRIPDSITEKLRIVIENKVYSKEHTNQTQKYYDYHETSKSYNDNGECIEQCLYIYLTPPSNSKDADCKHFIHITYQNLLDHILERSLILPNLNERTKFILTEYISSLTLPSEYIDKQNQTKKIKTIMAIGERERALLQSFWSKYSNLFMAALTAISTDENASEEDKKEVNSALNAIQQFEGKKHYRYSINNQGQYAVGRVVVELIRKYIDTNPTATLETINKSFNQPESGKLALPYEDAVKENTTPKGKKGKCYKRYFTDYPLELSNGTQIAISSQWGNNERFDNFVEKALQIIPKCEVKRIV